MSSAPRSRNPRPNRKARSSNTPRPAVPSHSAQRREAKSTAGPCPIMRACGGCAWIGMPYRKQLARKQQAMEELFSPLLDRMGWHLKLDPVWGMGAHAGEPGKASAPRGFRHKAQTPFAPGQHGEVLSGLYAQGTHDIVAVPDCPVEAPGARAILNEVARTAEHLGIPAFDEDTRRGILRYAVLRMGWRTEEAMLTLVTAKRDLPRADEFAAALMAYDPRIVCVAHNINTLPGNAVLGPVTKVIAGKPCMRDQLLNCTFEISPTAFYQTNPRQTEVLYQLAIDGMGLQAGDTLIDAYCGSGTIGITALRAAVDTGIEATLIGVERNAAGIADAQRNAELNSLGDRARFIAEDATAYLERAAGTGEHADVVVLDPPRAGSTPEFLEAAAAMAPRTVVYISCNPATQVRDLEVLGKAGYALTRLTPVDLFPHTPHVETVAVLNRR